ncbi:MAG: hypothetical protein NZ551_12070 [Microscillaceae bacterium]|nr:hypothetical protein [Microscillaceae bacterium]MDW8461931.1 hypothetical protein [Cytophagales bacterium]
MNLEKGRFGKLTLPITVEMFKQTYPCFSKDETNNLKAFCGGGLYYDNLRMVYFPQSKYIQISEGFKGKVVPAVLGLSEKQVGNLLGTPKRKEKVQTLVGEVQTHWYFKKRYGCYSLVFEKDKVVKINIHFTDVENSQICD